MRATSNLGRVLAFIAVGFTLVLVGIFIARAIDSPGDTATALFQVSNEQSNIFDNSRLTIQEFEILKKTQLALLKSNYRTYGCDSPAWHCEPQRAGW